MWVARDKNEKLIDLARSPLPLGGGSSPWNDEPIEVELVIKKRNTMPVVK